MSENKNRDLFQRKIDKNHKSNQVGGLCTVVDGRRNL